MTLQFGSIQRLVGSALVLQVAFALPGAAQSYSAPEQANLPSVAAPVVRDSGYRAGIGERAMYDVEYKGHGVGSGSLEIIGRESTNGFATYHAALKLNAGWLFAKVNEEFDSWFDPTRYFSRRFMQDQHELTKSRKRNYEITPESGRFHETVTNVTDSLNTREPLDDISFLFYVRTLPLKVGDVDTIPRYFKAGRDVIVKVVRRENVTVPAGTFSTIVVQPTITNAGGLFGQGGKAEVYLSDDARRTVVKLTSTVPVIGSLALTLRDARAGVP